MINVLLEFDSLIRKAMNLDERISNAKWVLERNLSWIISADAKIAVITTINLAMLTVLATIYFSGGSKSTWVILMSIAAFLTIVLSLVFVWFVVVPRISGPNKSNIFFGKIANVSSNEFCDNFLKLTSENFLADLIEQIHINSRIANQKHEFVRRAYFSTMLSLLPWLASVVMLKGAA